MTDLERLVRLETALPTLQTDMAEVKADVKKLLATHNQHQGMARLGLMVWTTVAGVVGGFITMLLGKHL